MRYQRFRRDFHGMLRTHNKPVVWELKPVVFAPTPKTSYCMKAFSFLIALFFLVGCKSKAEYSATFNAPKSKLTSSVESAVVYKNAETLVGNRGFARIRICPERNQPGKPLDFQAQVVRQNPEGYEIFELVTDSGTLSWSWNDYAPLLDILRAADYADLDEEEIKRLNHALFNALSSPKGFVMKGQGKGIVVLSAAINRTPDFDPKMQYNNWIEPTGLKPCGSS